MFKRILISTCLLNLAACASIVEGSTQNITVDTNPNIPTSCILTNDRGSWDISQTPATATIKRSKSDLRIVCDSPTHSGQLIQSSDAESWGVGNVLAGGIIGAGVDAGTGAMFSYNDEITVPLSVKPDATYMGAPSVPVTSSTAPAVENAPQSTDPYASFTTPEAAQKMQNYEAPPASEYQQPVIAAPYEAESAPQPQVQPQAQPIAPRRGQMMLPPPQF